MEYEFIHDVITGDAKAKFSLEHQMIGPWIEIELGADVNKLKQVLTAVDQVSSGEQHSIQVTGKEYSLMVSDEDVLIQANAMLNGQSTLPDELLSDDLSFDQQEAVSCGIEDFRTLLLSWSNFTKK